MSGESNSGGSVVNLGVPLPNPLASRMDPRRRQAMILDGRVPFHCVAYGLPGAGKTRFAASVANYFRPALVLGFDVYGKLLDYLDLGEPTERQSYKDGVEYQDTFDPDTGEWAARVEYMVEEEAVSPQAYSRFVGRMTTLRRDVAAMGIKSVIVDSITPMTLFAKKWHQYGLNPDANDPRQWYGGAKDLTENPLLIEFSALPVAVVMTMHIRDDKTDRYGQQLMLPAATGTLSYDITSRWPELYYCYTREDGEGNVFHLMQTGPGEGFFANTALHPPNPCGNDFAALFQPASVGREMLPGGRRQAAVREAVTGGDKPGAAGAGAPVAPQPVAGRRKGLRVTG